MDKGGGFSVETVQPIRVLIDESIVLGNKLPSDLRRNDIVVNGSGVRGGSGVCHDELLREDAARQNITNLHSHLLLRRTE